MGFREYGYRAAAVIQDRAMSTLFSTPFRVVAVSIGLLAALHGEAVVADWRPINEDQEPTHQADTDAGPLVSKPTAQTTDKYAGSETLVADTHKASLEARDRVLHATTARNSCWPHGAWGGRHAQ